MATISKKYKQALEKIDRTKTYEIEEALNLMKELPGAKFDESVDASVRLNLDKNQRVRGILTFPHAFGKPKRVVVIAKGEKAEEATKAGADIVGDVDVISKIKKGWNEFDTVVTTPDMMKDVSKLGPVLGKKGLMPNPKAGTVTFEIKQAVEAIKKGKVEFRSDKAGIVNISFGKASMDSSQLIENIKEFYTSLVKSRPPDVKGEYIMNFSVSKTMSPGIKINYREIV